MTFNPCKYVPGCSLMCGGLFGSFGKRCVWRRLCCVWWWLSLFSIKAVVGCLKSKRSLLSLPFLSKESVGDSSFVCCYSGMRVCSSTQGACLVQRPTIRSTALHDQDTKSLLNFLSFLVFCKGKKLPFFKKIFPTLHAWVPGRLSLATNSAVAPGLVLQQSLLLFSPRIGKSRHDKKCPF